MADRTRLSGTQAGGRVGTFRRTRMARLPPSRHPLHCGLRIPNLRAREDSPLSKSCHQGVPAICLTPRLPVQRIRHCGLNATFRTRLQQCDGDWWSLSPRCYRVAHVARLGTGVEICDTVRLALLWQIYSCRCALQIHFRQCGHRWGGGRAISSRMAWRTAGKVGCGGGPLILFFPPCCFEPAILEESVGDHRHERVTMQALPGSAFEVIKTKFFFQLLVSLLANPSRLDGGRQVAQV